MTDNDIIKALECCSTDGRTCEECPYNGQTTNEIFCDEKLQADALDLINRQNKEIDRLSQCVLYHDGIVSDLEKDVFNARTDAIKEFAERLKERVIADFLSYETDATIGYIDNLVKEMVSVETND